MRGEAIGITNTETWISLGEMSESVTIGVHMNSIHNVIYIQPLLCALHAILFCCISVQILVVDICKIFGIYMYMQALCRYTSTVYGFLTLHT